MSINVSTGFNFSTADPSDTRMVKGDVASRDAIPLPFRYQGLVCWTITEAKWWQLRGGVDNINWVDITSGSGTDLTGLGTDKKIARWNGTDTLQDTNITIDDSNNVYINGNDLPSANTLIGADGSAIFNEQNNTGGFVVKDSAGNITFTVDYSSNQIFINENTVINVGDSNLYRSAVNELKTDGDFFVVGWLQAQHLRGSGFKSEVLAPGFVNDYDTEEVSWVKLDPNGGIVNLTGFNGGTEGRFLVVSHTGSLGTITLLDENANSNPINRMTIPGGSGSIQPGEGKILCYDSLSQRWKCITFS